MAKLFRLTQNSVFEDNPEIKTMKPFRELSENEMKYIIMVYDHYSPYRRMAFDERKHRALIDLGYYKDGDISPAGMEIAELKEEYMQTAVNEYKEVQGWSPIDLLAGIDSTLKKFNKELEEDDMDIDDRIKIAKAIPDLIKKRQEILFLVEGEIHPEDKEVVVEEEETDDTVSAIDRYAIEESGEEEGQ